MVSTTVESGLSGLALADAVLASRSAAFVVSGKGEGVLRELRAHAEDLGTLLGRPGRLQRRLDITALRQDVRDGAEASLAARDALYRQAGTASVPMLVRLGRVLNAADHERHLDRTGCAMPDWLHYLLNDALWASCPDDGANLAARQPVDALVAIRPAWDIALVAALLVHAGEPAALAIPVVFERCRIDGHFQPNVYLRLSAPGVLDDYLLAHPADVAGAAGVLAVAGREQLVARLDANPALRDAFDALLVTLSVETSIHIRPRAARHVLAMDPHRSAQLLGATLATGTPEERLHAADLLARLRNPQALAVLTAALAAAVDGPLRQAIANALARSSASAPIAPTHTLGADAIDLLLANRTAVLADLRTLAAAESANNLVADFTMHFAQRDEQHALATTETDLRLAIAALNGAADQSILQNHSVAALLRLSGHLAARPDVGLLQVLRLLMAGHWHGSNTWHHPDFQAWLGRQDLAGVDLLQVAELAEACGGVADDLALVGMAPNDQGLPPHAALPADRVWPLYAARPGLVDEGLGLASCLRIDGLVLDLGCTLDILATFPALPARWLERVLALGLGESKTHGPRARQMLERVPDIGLFIAAALASTRQDTRMEAARWLADRGDVAAVPALHAALKKETKETASAALLTALERLGEDMAPHLAPAKLLAQATNGLKAKPPASMAWLALDTAPACTWDAGGTVDARIVRWWLVLAIKLKEPAGNPLLDRYLRLLAPGSQAALGRWALHQFLARDRAQQPVDVAVAWARANLRQRLQEHQRDVRACPEDHAGEPAMTPDAMLDLLRREKMAEYLGSAIGEKGMLALIRGVPGVELVSTIEPYLRAHYVRRAQVEALVEAAGGCAEPAVIQFLLDIVRRYRTQSVRDKARVLVDAVAARHGWSEAQLADRTVPTGGLDDNASMVLEYGARTYTVTLDGAMKPVLRDADGNPVTALPAPRPGDSPDAIKDARLLLANCKKEIKQVADMQSARLYDAMCAQRSWTCGEWQTYVQRHPLVGRLAQRLVWLETAGAQVRAFRPLDDGSLIDAQDNDITLADGATIVLAHGALLSRADAAAWVRHGKDYKVAPLFAQATRTLPGAATGDAVDDRLGWLGDAFKLRTAFTRLGYQRGEAAHHGVFDHYKKEVGGLTVLIGFSGNTLPEENVRAALTRLSIRHTGSRDSIALDQVPVVLLAEAWADYHGAAAACTGFDAAWESKVP